jgi:hypothetical protein
LWGELTWLCRDTQESLKGGGSRQCRLTAGMEQGSELWKKGNEQGMISTSCGAKGCDDCFGGEWNVFFGFLIPK